MEEIRVNCADCGWSNLLDCGVKWYSSSHDPDVYYCPACSELCECECCGVEEEKPSERKAPKGWKVFNRSIAPPVFVCKKCLEEHY